MHSINYIILAHNNPIQLNRLIKNLSGKDIYIYIHIDSNANINALDIDIDIPNVFLCADRIACSWGDFSLVKATLKCIEKIIADQRKGHTILLSGQDLPIQTTDSIKSVLEKNESTEFIDCKPIKEVWPNHFKYRIQSYKYDFSSAKADFVCIPSIFSMRPKGILRNVHQLVKRALKEKNIAHLKALKYLFIYKKPPKNTKFYGGSQWWCLTNSTLEKLDTYLKSNPEFYNFFEQSVIPDEVFFQTAIMNLKKQHFEIEIMPTLTYARWKSNTENSPDTFTLNDLNEILIASKNFLFARKFNSNTDENIILAIENCIKNGDFFDK